jgi:hypothetical protein
MRSKFFAACFAMTVLISCNKKDENKKPLETAAPEATAMLKGKSCYTYAKGMDTISMTLAMNANNANGELQFKNHQKDSSSGTFSGTFIGDTLFADYTFQSEGTTSVMEKVFLKKGNTLVAGFGDMEERNNKQCFIDPKNVTFDPNGIVLEQSDCK